MRLQAKLIAAFGGVAVITLAVSLLGLWQASRLASALYEVGVVRLPSIEGLNSMWQAKTDLDASERALFIPGANASTVAGEVDRQARAWKRAERGWALYEPLPQTTEEAATWKVFVPAWNAWRASYDSVVSLVEQGHRTANQAQRARGQRQSLTTVATQSASVDKLLATLKAINDSVATATKQRSVDSYQDLARVRSVMLFAAMISVLSAVGWGVVLGRRVSRPLVQSEEKFSKVFMLAPVGIGVTYLADGRFFDANAELQRLLGYSHDELIGRSSLDLGLWVDPTDRAGIVARTQVAGEVQEQEVRLRAKGGKVLTVRYAGQTIQLDGVPMLLSAFQDLTDRRLAEEELRHSEQQYRELVDGVRDVIVAMTPEGTLTALNPAFEQITGMPRADWVGKPFFGLLHSDEVERALELFRAVLRDEPRPVTVFRVRTANGEVRLGEIYLTTQRKNGEVVGVLGIARDVTDRVQLEEQFRQAQKMEAVGRLAGGVAHDFNNLLTVIAGYSGLLLRDLGADDPKRAGVEAISRAGAAGAALTSQLLAFGRQQVFQPTVLNVNEVVGAAGKMLARLIGEDVHLETALAPDAGRVRADAGQLEQVMMNLAVNARDAMPQGGLLRIGTANVDLSDEYVSKHVEAKPGPYVVLAVTDSGIGMDERTKARAFEPFFTTKPVGQGTGLGLASVFGIVKQSGGFVEVESKPGQGASFKIYLPRVNEPADVAPVQEPAPRGGTETVLLVEDAPALRSVARRSLERHGYTVLEAADGHAALTLVAGHRGPIHLLLTDVVMPGMSGREVAKRVTELRAGLRTLFMSGYTDDVFMRQGVMERGLAYLEKPFTPDGLARKVRDVLDAPQDV